MLRSSSKASRLRAVVLVIALALSLSHQVNGRDLLDAPTVEATGLAVDEKTVNLGNLSDFVFDSVANQHHLAILCFKFGKHCPPPPPPPPPPPVVIGPPGYVSSYPPTIPYTPGSANATELPDDVPEEMPSPTGDVSTLEYGTSNLPFTTRPAYISLQQGFSERFPYSASGLLTTFHRGGRSGTCTASLIGPSLLVTAAHCMMNFGSNGADDPIVIIYQPSRFEEERPFGNWGARKDPNTQAPLYFLSSTWRDGTDPTDPQNKSARQNDLAVVVLEKNSLGQTAGSITGYNGFGWNKYGAGIFFDKGETDAWAITQLGYPSNLENTNKRMLRNDAPATPGANYQMLIGTAMKGGSSGGPWLANFGASIGFTEIVETEGAGNVVMGVSAWAYTTQNDLTYKGGASMFSQNDIYRNIPNIVSLVQEACNALPETEKVDNCGSDRLNIPLPPPTATVVTPLAFGGAEYPYTMRGAYTQVATPFGFDSFPTNVFPWAANGKLLVRLDDGTFRQRSATLIGPGLLVTAAEALAGFNRTGPRATEIAFQPGKFDDTLPFGQWTARDDRFTISPFWVDGTDNCDEFFPVVYQGRQDCDNNIAVITLRPNDDGLYPGEAGAVGSWLNYRTNADNNDYSFTNQYWDVVLGEDRRAGQVTTLGYPRNVYNGTRMVRTDSVGTNIDLGNYFPTRYRMGSGQDEGGIGSGWIVNFGPEFINRVDGPGTDPERAVIGVTSWTLSTSLKLQGGSRFGHNPSYPSSGPTNIESLIAQACNALDQAERDRVCGPP